MDGINNYRKLESSSAVSKPSSSDTMTEGHQEQQEDGALSATVSLGSTEENELRQAEEEYLEYYEDYYNRGKMVLLRWIERFGIEIGRKELDLRKETLSMFRGPLP